MNYKKIEEILLDMVNIKSDTGTKLEKDIEKYIYKYISTFEYFKNNKNHYGRFDVNDEFERKVIWALVKGIGEETIVLLHHHDVVDSLDYGKFKKYAYSPKELKKQYKTLEFSQEIKEDLNSNKWYFGRGTADMKAGAAIQLEILKHYSEKINFNGNILLLSVPDEENLSIGMRKSIGLLNKLKDKFNLKYELLINSEPHTRKEKEVGTIYDGSVGKIMPIVYVKGFKSHIGEIFSGFNPLLILSKIAINIETNMDFSDSDLGEVSPPPTWIYLRDFKKNYDVSVPEAAGGYFSILPLKQTPKEILNKIKHICEITFKESINILNNNYKIYSKDNAILSWNPKVKFFNEIYKEAKVNGKEEFEKEYKELIKKLKEDIKKGKINIPNSNFILIKKVLEYTRSNDPIVVIGISPPYYPPVSNENLDVNKKISNIKEIINKKSKEFGESYDLKRYFMGISDLSYTSLIKGEEVVPYIEENTPIWNHIYEIDFENLKQLRIPVINIGPWGKDLHKMTERVYMTDVVNNTPKLIMEVVDKVLSF
ncbi:M20/M25/M40 family metallo-hydrolase [Senegalia massiliensis]|uniref:M20/M25/M40 family metallo-hydrolase n=1 Tax=Senegalia massiliensis TaxID=1720316 RepID=A0A845QZ17_9CLOT|nr:M20/M25/M40 family metallo-hydrolase [Senegalia massiliensis]NBI08207.1 M20/M25/M40 family metallo-hydrolase [Senegalia massiliensis]